jgi:uncharacterized membrane protein (UPF0127 family)
MRILKDIFLLLLVMVTLLILYQNYGTHFLSSFTNPEVVYTVYIDTVALSVTLADTDAERREGLSGVSALPALGGKLFIFDTEERHGIWMKDMQFPIDVIWFNNNLELIHFEENLNPATYPTIFAPSGDARFVLETNANVVDALNIQKGARLILPSSILPKDIRQNL